MRRTTERRRLGVWLAGGLALAGCVEPPPWRSAARRAPARPAPRPAPSPTALECSFDPASRPGHDPRRGFDLCFTPAAPPTPLPLGGKVPILPDPELRLSDFGVAEREPCPDGMVLIEGNYCPKPAHRCLRYLDEQLSGGFLRKHRCAEYAREVECRAPRERRRFCIDRDEYTAPGAELPLIDQSWTLARATCESLGKRLCFESEWEFACQGEAMWPYPYGFTRDAGRCNHDITDLSDGPRLKDWRVKAADRPECVSAFGVRHLTGNADEWVWRDGYVHPYRSGLRGGWWLAGRNNCIAATTAHDEYYFGAQTGFRCCADAE
ncbi:MAG: SUMF1/EgtB/PvdO family nonheme iron enzyme [Polyangiaceae bacterium]|nr:SUMF1/EgtB/PvdO family nonheme iron enzyme [Polyangiaceae bacterium]